MQTVRIMTEVIPAHARMDMKAMEGNEIVKVRHVFRHKFKASLFSGDFQMDLK